MDLQMELDEELEKWSDPSGMIGDDHTKSLDRLRVELLPKITNHLYLIEKLKMVISEQISTDLVFALYDRYREIVKPSKLPAHLYCAIRNSNWIELVDELAKRNYNQELASLHRSRNDQDWNKILYHPMRRYFHINYVRLAIRHKDAELFEELTSLNHEYQQFDEDSKGDLLDMCIEKDFALPVKDLVQGLDLDMWLPESIEKGAIHVFVCLSGLTQNKELVDRLLVRAAMYLPLSDQPVAKTRVFFAHLMKLSSYPDKKENLEWWEHIWSEILSMVSAGEDMMVPMMWYLKLNPIQEVSIGDWENWYQPALHYLAPYMSNQADYIWLEHQFTNLPGFMDLLLDLHPKYRCPFEQRDQDFLYGWRVNHFYRVYYLLFSIPVVDQCVSHIMSFIGNFTNVVERRKGVPITSIQKIMELATKVSQTKCYTTTEKRSIFIQE
jgi:hypothetical protein